MLMSKIGKGFLAKLVGTEKNCCCCGPSILSIKKIKIDNKDTEIIGLEEEFEKLRATNQAPGDVNAKELIQNIAKINVIPEDNAEVFKVTILNEYTKYWNENKT